VGSDRVGILVNDCLLQGIPRGRTLHENIQFYQDGGRMFDLQPIYFRLQDVQIRNNTVKAFVLEKKRYKLHTFPIPKVIHQRALYLVNAKADLKLAELIKCHGTTVFNRRNRYTKWHVHQLMMQGAHLQDHLPQSAKASLRSILRLGQQHHAVIIKPTNSSIGRGIMKLDRTKRRWRLVYQNTARHKNEWRTVTHRPTLIAILRKKIRMKSHIVQQMIQLATYRGNPFDLRVSVQRGIRGIFQVTGIAAKVAQRNMFVTNVAQGGRVYPIETVLREHPHLDPTQIKEAIHRFALRAANYLSYRLPGLADIGFDIGLTSGGQPVFIEMNLRDLRYSFREAGMMDEWRQTYMNPMGYARAVLDGNLERLV
jgi:glutathione synthase/RimK-type ligase-like ATP-grasp enzyme